MAEQQSAAGFPEIRVPAALTFAALLVGFVIGTLLRGTAIEAPVMPAPSRVWPKSSRR